MVSIVFFFFFFFFNVLRVSNHPVLQLKYSKIHNNDELNGNKKKVIIHPCTMIL